MSKMTIPEIRDKVAAIILSMNNRAHTAKECANAILNLKIDGVTIVTQHRKKPKCHGIGCALSCDNRDGKCQTTKPATIKDLIKRAS